MRFRGRWLRRSNEQSQRTEQFRFGADLHNGALGDLHGDEGNRDRLPGRRHETPVAAREEQRNMEPKNADSPRAQLGPHNGQRDRGQLRRP